MVPVLRSPSYGGSSRVLEWWSIGVLEWWSGPDCANGGFLRWFEQDQPDALLVSEIDLRGKLEAQTGLRFPRDTGLALLRLPRTAALRGSAGIRQNIRKASCHAVDLVAAALARGDYGLPEHRINHLMEGEWVDGKTLPPKLNG